MDEPITAADPPQGTMKPYIVPVLSMKSGKFKYKHKKKTQSQKKDGATDDQPDQNDCCIVYEQNTSKLYFKLIDQKLFTKTGQKKVTTLEFTDITAADLKVMSKFGSWDTMSCRLLVENYTPLVSWTVEKLGEVEGLAHRETDAPLDGADCGRADANTTAYVRREQESCMVKATFDVGDLQRVRELLHTLKINKLRERRLVIERNKQDADNRVSVPSKIREGLPEWVNYIPAKWYSSTVRQVFEYILVMYTLLTLTWAIWQLYKHVGFIRQLLSPVLKVIEFYLEVLRNWFRWLDQVTDVITNYWWMYMKPVYLLAAPLYTALAALFKPLRNVADVIAMVTRPVTSVFHLMATAMRPLLQPAFAAYNTLRQAFDKLVKIVGVLWETVARWAVVRLFIEKLQGMGLQRFVHELSNTNLDPLKAQMALMQNLLLKSSKQIFYGLRFIFLRFYHMTVFVKRERDYAREDEATVAKEKAE